MQKKVKKIPKVEIYDLMPKVEDEVKEVKNNYGALRYLILSILILLYGLLNKFGDNKEYWLISLITFWTILCLLIWWLKDD